MNIFILKIHDSVIWTHNIEWNWTQLSLYMP